MKKQIFILMILIFYAYINPVFVINSSIPKCGTFLLEKAVRLIMNDKSSGWDIMDKTYVPSFDIIQNALNKANILCLHLVHNRVYEEFIKKNNIKFCFIYRDPRDQLVSQVHFMLNKSHDRGRFAFDSLLTALIGDNNYSPKRIFYPFQDIKLNILSSQNYISHIRRFYEGFLGWKNSSVCCAIKFEDLVGPKGGGTDEKQRQTISKIAKHIGVNISQQQIVQIASDLFGSTWTFREGQIGSWRKHFKEEHVHAFKTVAGNLLPLLGYEQNDNWHL